MQMGMPRFQPMGNMIPGGSPRGGGGYRGPMGGSPGAGAGLQSGYQPRPQGGWYGSKQQQMMMAQSVTYDGKRMRKAVFRKTVDYNSSVVTYLENRIWQRDHRDMRSLGTDPLYSTLMIPPPSLKKAPMNCVTTKFIRTSTNKIRCPIFCVCWTPEGRRLITGASSGEFTLWNGLTFNFETILQAHDSSVRSMVWSHNDLWMLTADHAGFIKYWQSNMNNVKMYQAHKDPVRGLSFCPTDTKFASCSDDGTVRVWDFVRCHEERILRGHGADVKCIDWHPVKSLLASGSKDTQQPVKLWDARTGTSLATIHAHKHTVMEVKWNKNGNWLLTASRDHLLKLFDVRKMKEELQTFKGHKKEATTIAWHPIHESLFTSGGSDGAIMFWLVGHDKEVGSIDEAHETMVWSLAWHPLGHILASGSNDHTTKFWTRNRVGDRMRDKYNLNTLPIGTSEDMLEYDNDYAMPSIPGMGLEFGLPDHLQSPGTAAAHNSGQNSSGMIPGLGMDSSDMSADKPVPKKKVPYAKPIPKNFEKAWESGAQPQPMTPAESNARQSSSSQPSQTGSGAASNYSHPPPPGGPPSGGQQPRSQAPPPFGQAPTPRGMAPPRAPQQQGYTRPGFQPRQPNMRQPRPAPPQHYGQRQGYNQQGQGYSQPSQSVEQSVEAGLKEVRGAVDQWGQTSGTNPPASTASGQQVASHGYDAGSYSEEYEDPSNVNGGAYGYGYGYEQRGRGRGRGGMGRGQGGMSHYGMDPNQAASLGEGSTYQKRSWEEGPGGGGAGADGTAGGSSSGGSGWGAAEAADGMGGHNGGPPAKYGRSDLDMSQQHDGGYHHGGPPPGRPPYHGGRGGPPMRGGPRGMYRGGGRGGPSMGRGRGGRGRGGRGW